MIEVEIKIPIEDRQCLEKRLEECGFQKGMLVKESDTYFNSDHYDLRKMDCALRIRNYDNLTDQTSRSEITYKGPKLDAVSMTRQEYETEIQDETIGINIINALGFYMLPPVNKLRQYYHKDLFTACIDQVEGLGDFLELEILVADICKKDAALEQLLMLIEEIGLKKTDMIRTSYLSMLETKAGELKNERFS